MRVVSLAPSATETVAALGGTDRLVGVTHHCEPVPEHRAGTAAASSGDASSSLDAPAVGGWLNPDYSRVADLDPDVVLTSDALQREIRDDVRDEFGDANVDVHHVEPATLDDVLSSFSAIGDAVGLPDAGERLEAESRERVERVRRATPGDGPVVYCEEWSDPPMAAGNWVPDAVEAAGGRYPFVDPGERSREIDPGAVRAADPDHAVVHVCGKGDRVDSDPAERWNLDADVHVVDDSLLNQPSPRLLDGIERLADVFGADPGGASTRSDAGNDLPREEPTGGSVRDD